MFWVWIRDVKNSAPEGCQLLPVFLDDVLIKISLEEVPKAFIESALMLA